VGCAARITTDEITSCMVIAKTYVSATFILPHCLRQTKYNFAEPLRVNGFIKLL